MVLLATPVASHLGGTTLGGFGAAAIAAGSHGRAFPAATTAAAAGVHSMTSMASVGPLLPVSRKSVVPLSNGLHDVIAADTVTRCQVPCLHLVFGRQSVDEDSVQHMGVKCQA